MRSGERKTALRGDAEETAGLSEGSSGGREQAGIHLGMIWGPTAPGSLALDLITLHCHSTGRLCPGPPPVPCPPGTFLSRVSPHNTSLCHLCPRGFFNPWPGQDACFPCGSEATQPEEGKDTCICSGPGRVFQVCPLAVGPKDRLHFQDCFGL